MILKLDAIVVEVDAAGVESHRVYPAGTDCPVLAMVMKSLPEKLVREANEIESIVKEHRSKGETYFAVMLGGRPRSLPESYFKESPRA